MKLLHIDSSILGEASVTRQIGRDVVEQWRRWNPGLEVIYRDLAVNPPGHLSADLLAARQAAPEQLSPAQQAEAVLGETLLAEFLAADAIILGAPMYNFSIPTQLKAWVDHVLVAGRSFRYTENGPVGLTGGKQLVIVSARGGVYSEGQAQAMDHQESYLKTALGLTGIIDVTVIRAEGVNMGAERRAQAIAAALAQVRVLLTLAA
ncbi:MAG: NAD(P)H-dependent oxidoreductase [Gammaproteobacteria bacterium]|nr:NAD(P)H-dependent oxidoreductase [Gammaproteobacteria bacterium]